MDSDESLQEETQDMYEMNIEAFIAVARQHLLNEEQLKSNGLTGQHRVD